MDDNLKDEEILIRSLESPGLFELIVNKYQDSFVRTANRILRSREDAEDAAQEAFVRIYTNAKKFQKRPDVEFKSWAFRILINCTFTKYKKLKRTFTDKEYLDQLLYIPSEDAEILISKRETKDEIESVIERMPEDLAILIKEHYFEDRPYADIAGEKGMSVNALKMKLFRARKKFKEVFDEIG